MVSIVIPFGKQSPYLDQCISHCFNQSYKNIEVILLPDGPLPADETAKFSKYNAKLKIIPTGPMLPAQKRNIGIENAKGEIVAFLDDDAYPTNSWLESALKIFAESDLIGAVCGPAVTPAEDNINQQISGLIYSSYLASGVYRYRYVPDTRKEVDDYPTCNLLVKKKVLEEIGGFNSHFWPGEDTKLCLDIVKRLNKKIIYSPEVLVYHHRRPIYRSHLKQVSAYGLHRGYFAKRFPETSFRIPYLIPSLFVLGVTFGWFSKWIHPILFYIYSAFILIYLLLVVLTSASLLKKIAMNLSGIAKFKVFLKLAGGLIATHFTYGLYFILGLISRRLPEEQKYYKL